MIHRIPTALILLAASLLAGCTHFRAVEKGRLYRSGQMRAEGLERTLREHNIRTVISLRGPDPAESWYAEERAVCEALGVKHADLPWSRNCLPTPESLARLAALYRDSEGPVLVHCQGGVHRSAVAAAVYLLLDGVPLDEAREQLGPFFGRAPIGGLLDLYDESGGPFDAWILGVYPGLYAPAAGP